MQLMYIPLPKRHRRIGNWEMIRNMWLWLLQMAIENIEPTECL